MTTASNMILRANPGTSLTLDEMRASLPSIFADHPHDSRSDKYVYISTEDMLGKLMDSGFLPVEARMSWARDVNRRAFTKHMLRLRSEGELGMPSGGMNQRLGVAFEVILRNAHDGSGAYQLLAGLIRFACENGLVVSDGTVAQIKVYHRGSRRKLLDEILENAHVVLEQGPKVADKLRAWKNIELEDHERLEFGRQAHKLRFADAHGDIRTPIQPEQLIIPRRITDAGKSLWDIFNVVQENAIRGGLSAIGQDSLGRRRLRVSRGIHGIDGDVSLNRKLWELADKTAQEHNREKEFV